MDLINMGFDYEVCYVATQKYPNNPDRACNAVIENGPALKAEYVPYVPIVPGEEAPIAGTRKPNRRPLDTKPPHILCMSTLIPL
jgi:hypothetical protein